MDKAKQTMLEEYTKGVVEMIGQIPYGQVIPSNWCPPDEYDLKKDNINGVAVERIIPKENKSDRVVFYLHGGAFLLALLDSCRIAAVELSKVAGNAEVIIPDYRVAPTYRHPAALEDAVTVYQWMLEQGYDTKKVIFAGDSAGGNLVLTLSLYLRNHKMPLPKGIIAISPWVSMENNHISREYNLEHDLILGNFGLDMHEQFVNPSYAKGTDYKNPYISPIYGDFTGFPDILVQVGSYEVLYDEILAFAKKAEDANVTVRKTVYPEMSHDFQMTYYMLEETRAAWKEMQCFINDIMCK